MDVFQAVVLALIQGLTEFLPVSSSGHLVLPQALWAWPDQGLAFDVAVHLGSLVAVVGYFYRDLLQLATGWFASLGLRGNDDRHSAEGRRSVEDGRLAWLIILATVPAVLAGLIFDDLIEAHLRSAEVLAATTLFYGLLLGAADRWGRGDNTLLQMSWQLALLIGLAQALALVPGTSRSGITITAALFLGFSRLAAARFSFFLSVPLIAAAGLYKAMELLQSSDPVAWDLMAIGALVSALTAFSCIHVFLKLLDRIGMMPFVYYRIVLAVLIIVLAS